MRKKIIKVLAISFMVMGSISFSQTTVEASKDVNRDYDTQIAITESMINKDTNFQVYNEARTDMDKYYYEECMKSNIKSSRSCIGHSITAVGHILKPAVPAQGKPGEPGYKPGKPAIICSGQTVIGYCTSGSVTLTASCGCGKNNITMSFDTTSSCG